jgi:hypothetical protein
MLSPQQEQRIAREVSQCLEGCGATDRPFRQASVHIDLLHGDPHWSHDEIVEVQTRVLRALLDQRRPTSGSSPMTVPTGADQQ